MLSSLLFHANQYIPVWNVCQPQTSFSACFEPFLASLSTEHLLLALAKGGTGVALNAGYPGPCSPRPRSVVRFSGGSRNRGGERLFTSTPGRLSGPQTRPRQFGQPPDCRPSTKNAHGVCWAAWRRLMARSVAGGANCSGFPLGMWLFLRFQDLGNALHRCWLGVLPTVPCVQGGKRRPT